MLTNTLTPARIAAFVIALGFAAPGWAEITVEDAYARSATPIAKAGAVFLVIHNSDDTADRLTGATSPAAGRVEIHTHVMQSNGMMQMVHVEEGLEIPAQGSHALARGGDHVMLMGLKGPWKQGETVPLTLIFEAAGEITLDVVIDRER